MIGRDQPYRGNFPEAYGSEIERDRVTDNFRVILHDEFRIL
jgi:hypothetical protein